MADLIDRQAAIDALMKEWNAYKDYPYVSHVRHGLEIAIAILENKVPSAQPEQRWIDAIREVIKCSGRDGIIIVPKDGTEGWDENGVHYTMQPEYRLDEWCTDCKEYDQEKHCCPRFNHVIRTTLQDAQRTGRWIEHRDYPGLAYLCSECNYFTTLKSFYCPYCGARMEVEE